MKLKKSKHNNNNDEDQTFNGEGVEWQRNNQTMFRDNSYKIYIGHYISTNTHTHINTTDITFINYYNYFTDRDSNT